ncbi:tRNA 2-selenouridine(34) synthase MnmH [Phaeocystidibacter luteus]|uniref:tRNA 2-selenouridine(34) synthase MnmH n=1 Tax=Phaeocystidibacter luteus TaxID=911197 RepID=UPI001478C5DC|nr:tRNA 2-selenouridine(34) synthase MnmH [Phaeocystidibacter luteus]
MEVQFNPNHHFSEEFILLDVRAPSEFEAGHIPGAHSFPLFNDNERAEVGTLYKREGKDKAVNRGLEIVGPKLAYFVTEAKTMANDKTIVLYCWRGGMRSGSMEWLLETAGLKVERIKGGYKAYRGWANQKIESYSNGAKWRVLSGMTGSGKTEVLKALAQKGEQVIDLEGLAEHRGSAFGHLLMKPQPTTEHFMNLLGKELHALRSSKPIWIEDESRLIGKVVLPNALYDAIQDAPHYDLNVTTDRRAKNLVEQYGDASADQFKASFTSIKKRLGGLRYKQAVESVDNGDLEAAATLALDYYDKTYSHALVEARKGGATIYPIKIEDEMTFDEVAQHIIENHS